MTREKSLDPEDGPAATEETKKIDETSCPFVSFLRG